MNWEIVIGLETHTQLSTDSKIFSGSSTEFGAAPNTHANVVDLALPGSLPVMNRGAAERAIRFGLAVGATIAPRSVFARKNYFYPDLPKGYQISQYELPVVVGGSLSFFVGEEEKTVNLTRAHLEEDAGKSLHDDFSLANGAPGSGIDLNRAGTPLLEIVTEPEMRSAAEAVAYARALHSLVVWLGICDGNMQEGSFRCDANVSVRPVGQKEFGTRTEIKNVNSFRFLERAIVYEARRQIELIEDGGTVVQETRLYDADRDETRSMRSKEDAHDYRYFPDPDLRLGRRGPRRHARTAGRPARPFRIRVRPARLRRRPADRQPRPGRLLPGGGERAAGRPGQAGRQLGHGRSLRRPEQGRKEHRRLSGPGAGAGRPDRPHHRRHHLQQDRPRSLRRHVGRRERRSA
jgi:aspartyl/glutamyl-tRNA(Asn/Gln) amidotransferase B subunit